MRVERQGSSALKRNRRHGRRSPILSAAVILGVAAAVLLVGCSSVTITPSGSTKTETRKLDAFQHVTLEAPGTLTIVPAKESSLKITGDDNIVGAVSATIEGNTLVIELKRGGRPVSVGPGAKLDMELHTPQITRIENSGSGSVTGGPFSGTAFVVADSGSGSVRLSKVDVITLGTVISGSGTVEIDEGIVGAQEVTVSGSGSFSAPDLESRVATVRISGSGGVELWATEGLDATITGSGSVEYWGSPRLTEQASGSGRVRSLGAKESSGSGS